MAGNSWLSRPSALLPAWLSWTGILVAIGLLGYAGLGGSAIPIVKTVASSTADENGDVKSMVGGLSLDTVKRLPAKGMSVVWSDESNQMLILSDNGRFAVYGGKLLDVWNNKVIHSPDDVGLASRINLAKIGVKDEDMMILRVGQGPLVTMFVDPGPGCRNCLTMLAAVRELTHSYTFRLIPVPLSGRESADFARRLVCSKQEEAVEALLSGQIASLPQPGVECHADKLARNLVLFYLIGMNGMPLTIFPNGVARVGNIVGLNRQIEGNMQ
ncbi:MAG: hypothetical protein G8345_00690 [Magnetococcales bacterium]|nr:hypothetical protein [Magnetococcales bacterium]NGZ25385.1 hypothetical protein [Magnetococcales bacterium]